jgi:hypothetical protein
MVFASGVGLCLDSLNCTVSGASSGRGGGRTIKDAPLAGETVEQLDDFAGWIKAKRVELAPRASCPLSRKAERWPVAGWGDGRQPRKSEIRKLCEARGRFGNERGSGNVSRRDG